MSGARWICAVIACTLSVGVLDPVLSAAQQYTITTIAGGALPPIGVSAVQASIGDPPRVAVDASGNVYFGSLQSVFQVTPSGALVLVAGTGRPGYAGDGGPAASAQLANPDGIAADGAGDVYVSDQGNQCVRKISASGIISTVAGNGTAGFSGDGGPATAAQLNGPTGLALDAAGDLYIVDTGNNRVRVVSLDGNIHTVAGNGLTGYSGDNGAAPETSLNAPEGVAIDSLGTLFIADTRNDRVRAVTGMGYGPGIIATVAGIGNGDAQGDNGPATMAGLVLPTAVAVDGAGSLFIADFGNSRIRRVTPDGMIATVAGSNDGAPLADGAGALSVLLNGPTGLAIDAAGVIYFTEGSVGSGSGLAQGDHRVWRVANGVLTSFAGTGTDSYSGDGGLAATAQLQQPTAVALDIAAAGNVYIADTENHRVRRIAPTGIITTVAGNGTAGFSGDGGPATSAQLNSPQAVTVDSAGNLWIADTGNSRLRLVAPDGTIATYVGNGNSSYFGDGGRDFLASLNHPQGLAVDAAGVVYIADTLNHAIRRRGTDGFMSTLAGTGVAGSAGDGGPATSAQLSGPVSVAVDSLGNLYIADAGNQSVRKIDVYGTMTTIASGIPGEHSVAVDASGAVYVSAGDARRVLLIPPGGDPTAIAGSGGCCYTGDGGPSLNAALDEPWGLAVDSPGNVYVVDAGTSAVRELLAGGSISTAEK